MRSLRSTLCILYVIIGLPILVEQLSRGRYGLFQIFYIRHFNLLLMVADLFLPVTAILFLLAAVAYWRRWRWAKGLCILVSVISLAAVLLICAVFWWFGQGFPREIGAAEVTTVVVGVLGIVAFAMWKPEKEPPESTLEKTKALRGDGTWSWFNRSYVVVQYVVIFAVWTWLGMWEKNLGIPFEDIGQTLIWFTVVTIVVVTVHEAGHALCGLALGHKLQGFFAGPFQWRRSEGRWKFELKLMGFINTGGATAVVSQRLHEPRWKDICISAAGPGVNLVTGPVALWLAAQMAHGVWQRYWFPVASFGAISLMVAGLNLLPMRAGMQYSDGARIYQAYRGGVWYEMTQIFRTVMGTTVTKLRPRDMDIDAVQRVLQAGILSGPHELWMRLVAHAYYLDRSMEEQAGKEMSAAQAVYEQHAAEMPGVLLSGFVVHEATVRRDAVRARQWWERMTQKKPRRITADYWMAESALCWAEGRPQEAQAAWTRAQERLKQMPDAGTYAFDRDQLAKLKQVIDSASPVGEPEPVA